MMLRSLFHALVFATIVNAQTPTKPNILYLMSDDMRPLLGAYGHPLKTPHLDRLASTGLLFDFAYTQFAYCAPSRNSFMTGRRPERTKALNFLSSFRDHPGGESWITVPQFFKDNGYFTSSAGKLFHDGMDDPISWTYPSNQTWWLQCNTGDINGTNHIYCGITDESVTPYTDEDMILEEGLMRLDLAAASGKPWFVGIGIHRPHTEYRVPKGFYGTDLYPNGTVFPPKHKYPPTDEPWMAGNWEGGDIMELNPIPTGCNKLVDPFCRSPDDHAVEYRAWYYAAITWADHSLGRALTRLDELGLTNNTIVVFHSDHGYQLGELNEWSKKTATEWATHVPLIIRVPWKSESIAKRTTVRAELVDMYRTLVDLTGLDASTIQTNVQGLSLAPVFDAPENPAAWGPELSDKIAYSQIARCQCNASSTGGSCNPTACSFDTVITFDYMGYTMRTANWRFTAWVPFLPPNSTITSSYAKDYTNKRVDWDLPIQFELYDATGDDGRNYDFDGYSTNLALKPEHQTTVDQFHRALREAVNSWY